MTVTSAPVSTSSSTFTDTVATDQLRVVGVRRRTVVISVIAVVALAAVVALGWLVLRARSGGTTTPTSTQAIAGTLRGGPGFAAAAAAPAPAVSDLHVIAHGTRGFIRTAAGAAVGGSAANAPTPTSAQPSNDLAELVHGTAGSLTDASGARVR